MKGDWLAVFVLIVLGGLLLQAVDAPVMLWAIKAVSSWLCAFPVPEEHFADMLGKWAWPAAALVIAWWLREHIEAAAGALARRFESDDVEFGGGFFKLTGDSTASLATLDAKIATVAENTPEVDDAKMVESLLEYAGDSEENAERLESWISAMAGPTLDPEAFLNEDRFANDRKRAYAQLVEGNANG